MTTIRVWGNHHCKDDNKFEETFKDLTRNQDSSEEPIVYAKNIQCLSDRFIKNIRKTIKITGNNPQIHVIVVGSIDFHKGVTQERLVKQMTQIAKLAQIQTKVHIIISAIIPKGIPEENLSKITCIELNEEISSEIRRLPRVTIVRVDHYLHATDYVEPFVLNQNGGTKLAQLLAASVFNVMRC